MTSKTLEEKYNELVQIVQSLPKDGEFQLSNDVKLKFYGFYKQVTVGDVNIPQPYFFNMIERAKWDAWNAIKGMDKQQAMQEYLNEMNEAIKDAPYGDPTTQKIIELLK
jgi:diazepam-binding inhibitor (GABA receptor modulating acyl-CoA-binding protein)